MIAEQFDISRIAASRQLTRLILPKLTMDGSTLFGTDGDGDDDEGYDWMGEESILPNSLGQQHQYLTNNQPMRSIVISGVTSGRGRELFEYLCNHGHNVAGCGVLPSAIQSLKTKFPTSKLDVVDTTDVESVGQWASKLDASGMDIDMIIANAEVSPGPEQTRRCPAWEMTGADLDRTMDANVKGIHTMIRHFVPRLIQKNNAAATSTSGGVRKERVFVAMSPSMGARLDPLLAAHCASSFAVEGLIKCVAMSIPEPLSAITFSSSEVVDGSVQHDKQLASVGNVNYHSGGDESQWVNIAAPMLLHMNRDSNGKSMSI
jgi:NAD(P)-dependent dehydrogenase (short-subunit alcohol dehydrogenase family)